MKSIPLVSLVTSSALALAVAGSLFPLTLGAQTTVASSLRADAQPTASMFSSSDSPLRANWMHDGPSAGSSGYGGVARPVTAGSYGFRPFSRLAVGVTGGTLGFGPEIGVPLAPRLNLRAGANFFNYSTTIDESGITYDAKVTVRSVQTSVDWFPFHNTFHISPGAMLYNGNKGGATVVLPPGQSITINHSDYYSDTADPLHGTANISFPKAGPQLTVGFGNMVKRGEGKHFSVPVDFGFVYFGTGTAALNFGGSACVKSEGQLLCQKTSAYPEFEQNVLAEQAKIQKNLDYARFYPVLRVGLSYKF